jgi:hypothetical protein
MVASAAELARLIAIAALGKWFARCRKWRCRSRWQEKGNGKRDCEECIHEPIVESPLAEIPGNGCTRSKL